MWPYECEYPPLYYLHNTVNIEQAPKLLKDQIRMNDNIDKGGYNLRNKFQMN